jgi:aspartate aminotransferase-like enzyme
VNLGRQARALLERYGYDSVAAPGFQAPSVIVSYCGDPTVRSGQKFKDQGLQIAAGVPLQCGERADFSTFRIGLFGLDKLINPERTLRQLEEALSKIADT